MKRYKLTIRSTGRVIECDGQIIGLAPDKDMQALMAMEVGQSYVDGDGDTWERVE